MVVLTYAIVQLLTSKYNIMNEIYIVYESNQWFADERKVGMFDSLEKAVNAVIENGTFKKWEIDEYCDGDIESIKDYLMRQKQTPCLEVNYSIEICKLNTWN